MPDLTGYVSIRNNCGKTIKDVTLSVTVDGTVREMIKDPSLPDTLTTMNRRYSFPGGAATDWRVAFTLDGTQVTGTATCQLSSADTNQTLKIALLPDRFTLSPRAAEPVIGEYDL